MIITITNANFANCSIGQSTTWPITYSIGTGATKTGATSVTKDGSFSATITLKSGYEWSGSTTVTMGGSPVSNAVSVSGDTITITISKVTGAVRISQATSKVNTGGDTGGSGETILLIDNLTDLSTLTASQYGPTQGKNGSSFIERTNIETGKFIEYIDFYAIQPNKSLPTEPVNIANLKIYFVDSSTDTVKEMVFDESNYSSQNIDGVQIFRCNINKTTTYTTNIGITVNSGYETFSDLNSIPYISFAAGSNLEKPYFGAVISINSSYAGKAAVYYCPMNIYGK